MAQKKRRGAPVPPANKANVGPQKRAGKQKDTPRKAKDGTGFQEQDPKRRLGDFDGAGEHALVQPGGHNDANRH
jgi:hypothetical protein